MKRSTGSVSAADHRCGTKEQRKGMAIYTTTVKNALPTIFLTFFDKNKNMIIGCHKESHMRKALVMACFLALGAEVHAIELPFSSAVAQQTANYAAKKESWRAMSGASFAAETHDFLALLATASTSGELLQSEDFAEIQGRLSVLREKLQAGDLEPAEAGVVRAINAHIATLNANDPNPSFSVESLDVPGR